MSPGNHWIIVRRINPRALRIHTEYIILGEPEHNLNFPQQVCDYGNHLEEMQSYDWLMLIVLGINDFVFSTNR